MSELVQALERCAHEHPDHVVLVEGERRTQWRTLWRDASTLAHTLKERGLQPGARVALVGQNSSRWVQVWLATLIADGVVVPLNPELRASDLAAQVRHADARFVFADLDQCAEKALADELPGVTWLLGARDSDAGTMTVGGLSSLPRGTPDSLERRLGCILYTSGTTGAPKGVMLSRDSMLANGRAVVDYLGLDHRDASLALLPFYYSFGHSVLLTHLLSGARLVFGASLMFPEKMMALVAREHVTGLSGVPTMFQLLRQRQLFGDSRWASLRYVAQAGGKLPRPVVETLRSDWPEVSLYLMYGQTEATARISYLPPELADRHPDSAGKPLPDTEIEIRDEDGHEVSAGETGYIHVRGPGVMLGYWKDPEATERVLTADGWLKTGDMGRVDESGLLYIQGRRSDMLKINGQRVHPQELEAVISELPQVSECAVDGVEDKVQGQIPRAFVVVRHGCQLDGPAIQRHCRAQLASWKIPRRIEIVEHLPRTVSGKVQRHRLKELVVAREDRA